MAKKPKTTKIITEKTWYWYTQKSIFGYSSFYLYYK